MNVTLSIPEDILNKAREHARGQSTTVNQLIRDFLLDYSRTACKHAIAEEALQLLDEIAPTLPHGTRISRDEMEQR